MAIVIVGNLDGTLTTPRLLMSRELPKTDNVTITDLVFDALAFLWPDKLPCETRKKFLMFLTDAAPYMVKAGKNLKTSYHVTCVAHGLHRVAEAIRTKYNNVNVLMGSIKVVFKKRPERIRTYHEMCPGLSLPPEPVITRWGTWIEAVTFYAVKFAAISNVVEQLDEDSAECFRKAQTMLKSSTIKGEIAAIARNYGFLPGFITKLETRSAALVDVVELMHSCQSHLEAVKTRDGKDLVDKFQAVLKKNPDIEKLFQISTVLKGESVATDLDPAVLVAFKFAPLTSVEVERSFSVEKTILSDRRTGFLMKNFENNVVITSKCLIRKYKQK